jgi:tetratricopeptide (TPR) repeat protein
MKTLYDLLGALPDDDAESLRTAFRQAAKATHPDSNTDDPDAPLKFRQIVRANAILSDADQRATYDRLLALTLRRPNWKLKRTIRKAASDAIKVACLSAVSIGGYLVFEQVSKASIVPVKSTEVTARARTEIAAVTPTKQFDTTGRDKPPDKLESAGVVSDAIVPSAAAAARTETAAVTPTKQLDTTSRDKPPEKLESAGVASDAIVLSAVAAAANTDSAQAMANAGPAPDLTAHDAKSYRERGIVAYLGGDLYRALADFDVAIQIDPAFADAYVDRGIVFYRIHEFDRAFADIAQAKRIKNSSRTKTLPLAPRKVSSSSAKN